VQNCLYVELRIDTAGTNRSQRFAAGISPDSVSKGPDSEGFDVTNENGNRIDDTGQVEGQPGSTFNPTKAVSSDLELDLQHLIESMGVARDDANQETIIDIDEPGVSLIEENKSFDPTTLAAFEAAGPQDNPLSCRYRTVGHDHG
jgi:hypothetical protein